MPIFTQVLLITCNDLGKLPGEPCGFQLTYDLTMGSDASFEEDASFKATE